MHSESKSAKRRRAGDPETSSYLISLVRIRQVWRALMTCRMSLPDDRCSFSRAFSFLTSNPSACVCVCVCARARMLERARARAPKP